MYMVLPRIIRKSKSMHWTGFRTSRSHNSHFVCPKGFRPRIIWQPPSALLPIPDIPPRRIVIKCTGEQPQYLRALPLHTSQEEIEQHEGWSLFAYYLAPTNEFFRKILSHREFMEIVAPDEVRQEYAEILRRMLELHK